MKLKESNSTIAIVLISSIILALAVSIQNNSLLISAFISFLIILTLNILAKNLAGYYFETNIKTKFWSLYHFGFRKKDHFKKPIYMAWLPLLISLFTRGLFFWLAIIEFDVSPKPERASKRHGLYRFTQITEQHIGLIAIAGLIINITTGIIGYLLGFETFAKFSIYFATWSLIPFSSLDGTKILFSNRILWIILAFITAILFGWASAI